MKFKLDENVPVELLDDLLRADHDASTLPDEHLQGLKDPPLMERLRAEGRIVITLDKGLADIRRFPPREYPGVVLLRPRTFGRGATLAFAAAILTRSSQSTSLDAWLLCRSAGFESEGEISSYGRTACYPTSVFFST